MELSPKQQAVNQIKNSKRVLVLGHKSPDGDQIGSLLALKIALEKLDKNVEVIISDDIESSYHFLPKIGESKNSYRHTDGKIIRIDTKRIPIGGMKWQREGDFLDIYLDTAKNLKFEFVEILNGLPKPDLIVVVDTPDIASIDPAYEQNTELFFEIPILNIDHHPGSEYFGTINLVDLTATSTAEILVSLFEALGIKIDSPDLATCLLAGILYDTQSFRGANTTPKSLTTAAQLLAAGGRQQEVIQNFYAPKPQELLKVWEILVTEMEKDETRHFAWSKIDARSNPEIKKEDVLGATEDILARDAKTNRAMIIYLGAGKPGTVYAQIEGRLSSEVLSLAKLFGGQGTEQKATFNISATDIDVAEKIIIKKLAEKWPGAEDPKSDLWKAIEGKEEQPPAITQSQRKRLPDEPTTQPAGDKTNSQKEKEDAIEEALKSISQAEKDENRKEMESLRTVIDRKKAGGMRIVETISTSEEIDVFEDE